MEYEDPGCRLKGGPSQFKEKVNSAWAAVKFPSSLSFCPGESNYFSSPLRGLNILVLIYARTLTKVISARGETLCGATKIQQAIPGTEAKAKERELGS